MEIGADEPVVVQGKRFVNGVAEARWALLPGRVQRVLREVHWTPQGGPSTTAYELYYSCRFEMNGREETEELLAMCSSTPLYVPRIGDSASLFGTRFRVQDVEVEHRIDEESGGNVKRVSVFLQLPVADGVE